MDYNKEPHLKMPFFQWYGGSLCETPHEIVPVRFKRKGYDSIAIKNNFMVGSSEEDIRGGGHELEAKKTTCVSNLEDRRVLFVIKFLNPRGINTVGQQLLRIWKKY